MSSANQPKAGVRRPAAQANRGNGRPRRNVTNNNNPNRARRVTRPPRGGTRVSTPWFTAASGTIHSDSPPGSLFQCILHPSNFQDTPYSRFCSDYLLRREDRVEVQLRCTTATTTGARIGFVVVTDPNWQNATPTRQLVLSLIANGNGSEYTVTQTTTQQRNFRVRTTTRMLSNSVATGNTTGISSGTVIFYLLDAPVAITGSGVLQWDLMLRLDMTLFSPCASFGDFSQGDIVPGPHTDAGFQIVLSAGASDDPMTENTWINSHTGDAWLAGGFYFRVPGTRPSQLLNGDPNNDVSVAITGNVQTYAIYTCSVAVYGETNQKHPHPIKYWVSWHEPTNNLLQFVGFDSNHLSSARQMALKQEGGIGSDIQLCLFYDRKPMPKWKEVFKIMLWNAITVALTGVSNSVDTIYTISFNLLETTKYSKPYYNTADDYEIVDPQNGLSDTLARSARLAEVDAGFPPAASCASSRSSVGSRRSSISCQWHETCAPAPLPSATCCLSCQPSSSKSPTSEMTLQDLERELEECYTRLMPPQPACSLGRTTSDLPSGRCTKL